MARGRERKRNSSARPSARSHLGSQTISTTLSSLANSMIGRRRKQMRPFLGDLLDGGEVEGLHWINKSAMTFRIPWKHRKKKDYDLERDTELIKLWAINTNRFGQDGQVEDPTTWKINFRCALNSLKESIVEVETNEEEDYRIYRFDDSKRGRLKSRPSQPAITGTGTAAKDSQPSSPDDSCSSVSSADSEPDSPMSTEEAMDVGFASAMPVTLATHTGISGYVSTFASSTAAQDVDHWAPDSHAHLDNEGLQQMLANLSSLSADSDCRVSDEFMESVLNGEEAAASNEDGPAVVVADNILSPEDPKVDVESEDDSGVENDKAEKLPDCHEIYVKVCYRGSPVAGMKVDHRPGCRIFFGPCPPHQGLSIEEQERLFGSRHLTQLALPTPGQAQSVLPSIWYLLDSLQRGIVLEVINNDIYATRLCHANVYWGAPAHSGDTSALERGVRTRIFNYQLFLGIYKYFRDNPNQTAIAAQPPTPNVLLGVGQPWGRDRQLDNNLVMICVTHCLAEHLMEMLHRHRWEAQQPFDTDYLMIDSMDEDDKLALSQAKLAIDSLAKDQQDKPPDAPKVKVTPLNLSALPMPVSSSS